MSTPAGEPREEQREKVRAELASRLGFSGDSLRDDTKLHGLTFGAIVSMACGVVARAEADTRAERRALLEALRDVDQWAHGVARKYGASELDYPPSFVHALSEIEGGHNPLNRDTYASAYAEDVAKAIRADHEKQGRQGGK